MTADKIDIQQEIEIILEREFGSMLESLSENPLFEIVKSGEIKDMTLDDVKKKVLGRRS